MVQTFIPITLPPDNATLNASFIFFVAAWEVLIFAIVAIFIPNQPEKIDKIAPKIKNKKDDSKNWEHHIFQELQNMNF